MAVMEKKVITGVCFGLLTNVFTQLTVHACDNDHSPETQITNCRLK